MDSGYREKSAPDGWVWATVSAVCVLVVLIASMAGLVTGIFTTSSHLKSDLSAQSGREQANVRNGVQGFKTCYWPDCAAPASEDANLYRVGFYVQSEKLMTPYYLVTCGDHQVELKTRARTDLSEDPGVMSMLDTWTLEMQGGWADSRFVRIQILAPGLRLPIIRK